jgi:hypothetical protein
MVAEHRCDAQRRAQPAERGGDRGRGDRGGAGDPRVDVIAEQRNHVRALGVHPLHDPAHLRQRHVRRAGVQVRDHGHAQPVQVFRPAAERDRAPGQPHVPRLPPQRPVGRRREG